MTNRQEMTRDLFPNALKVPVTSTLTLARVYWIHPKPAAHMRVLAENNEQKSEWGK